MLMRRAIRAVTLMFAIDDVRVRYRQSDPYRPQTLNNVARRAFRATPRFARMPGRD